MSTVVFYFIAAVGALMPPLSVQETFHAKIVGPPHHYRYFPSSSSEAKTLSLRAPPANISGPPHLRHLAGHCFKTRDKSYTYSVCPFHNVTQEEDRSAWNSYRGVLGVWREWIVEGDRFAGMLFEMGEKCTSGDRSVKVMLNCSTMTVLHNITEPQTCKYMMWLQTPLACFSGAMQVYHLLTPRQIEEWDKIMQEYHFEEITRKGMKKRQRRILSEAGLAYNFTIDGLYRKQEEQQATGATSWPQLTSSPQDMDECSKKKKELESEVASLKQELSLLKTVLDSHPALKIAVESLVAAANKTTVNGTTPTKTNSTRKENDVDTNRHITKPVRGDFATHQQVAYGRDSSRHGNDEHRDKVLGDRDIRREDGEIDGTSRPRDTIDGNHPVVNHDGNHPKDTKLANGTSFQASQKRKLSKDKPSKNLAGKSSLKGDDALVRNDHAQPADNISHEKGRRKLYEEVEAPG